MDYYERRMRATRLTDKMYSEGLREAKIIYKVSLLFGMSDKFVKNRIKLLEEMKYGKD